MTRLELLHCPSFSSDQAIRELVAAEDMALEIEEPILHDLDAVVAWLGAPS